MMMRYTTLLLIFLGTSGLILSLIFNVLPSFFINSIATILLVSITAIYAYLTYELVKETTQAREDAVVPVIRLNVDEWGPKLSNIGNGPALDLDVCLSLNDGGPRNEDTPQFKASRENLRAGDEIEIFERPFVTISNPDGDAVQNYEHLSVCWECTDIFGNKKDGFTLYEVDDFIKSEEAAADSLKEGVAQLTEIKSAIQELKAADIENQRIDVSNELVGYIREERERQRDRREFKRRQAEAGLLTRAKWWLMGMDAEERP